MAHAPYPVGYIARTRRVNFSPEHALRHVGCTIHWLLSVLISVLFVFSVDKHAEQGMFTM